MRTRDTRIIPVKSENQIASITKLASGDLAVTQRSGKVFVIDKDHELFQAFAVYTVLNTETTEAP